MRAPGLSHSERGRVRRQACFPCSFALVATKRDAVMTTETLAGQGVGARNPAIVSRFAPSPTGALHLGHAYSALLAHDFARSAGGRFFLRIEDIDPGRTRGEHITGIIDDLTWLGITWDGPVVRQSERLGLYAT